MTGKEARRSPLELSVQDPRGLEIQKQKISLSSSGYEQYSFRTEDAAQTGTYELALYIARDKEERKLLGSTSVKVEEFEPDRLSIRSRFSGDASKAWVSPKDLKATVTLMNLFGTPAADNTVQATISLSPTSLFFSKFPDYSFFDPLGEGKTFEDSLSPAKTNAAGAAEFALDLERFDNATFRLQFDADGLEKQGGRAVHTASSIIVSPLRSVVGFKPDGRLDYIFRDANRAVHFISVGPEQGPVPLTDLTLTVTEIRWVSVLEKGSDNLYHYKSVEKRVPVRTLPFAIPREGASLKLPTDSPGDYEVSISDKDTVKLSTLRFSVIGSGNLARSLDRNAELQVRLDRDDYAAGDPIKVSVKAPYTGSGLITIERDKVYAYKWFSTGTTATVQTIAVPDTVEGSAYVNVSFIRAIDSREIYTSPLSYGVVPISINKDARTNRITLKADPEILGGAPLKITYSSEKPGRIIVFAVDEGILSVARYRTPEPLEHFFAKRALEVSTSQILDLILPEFSIIQEVSAMGGDEGDRALNRGLNPFKRKSKAPVVFWSGILPTDAMPRTVEYQVPDYFNGSLRIMAVAVSDSAIGVQETRTLVRNHFVISPNVPAVVTPDDEVEIGVAVMNGLETKEKETPVPDRDEALGAAGSGNGRRRDGEDRPAAGEDGLFQDQGQKPARGRLPAVHGVGRRNVFVPEESLSIRPSTPFRTQLESGKDADHANRGRPGPKDARGFPHARGDGIGYLPSALSWGLKNTSIVSLRVHRADREPGIRRAGPETPPEFAVTKRRRWKASPGRRRSCAPGRTRTALSGCGRRITTRARASSPRTPCTTSPRRWRRASCRQTTCSTQAWRP